MLWRGGAADCAVADCNCIDKSFCVYDAPSPEAIRSTAQKNSLPVDKITEVRVLDPYFYR